MKKTFYYTLLEVKSRIEKNKSFWLLYSKKPIDEYGCFVDGCSSKYNAIRGAARFAVRHEYTDIKQRGFTHTAVSDEK